MWSIHRQNMKKFNIQNETYWRDKETKVKIKPAQDGVQPTGCTPIVWNHMEYSVWSLETIETQRVYRRTSYSFSECLFTKHDDQSLLKNHCWDALSGSTSFLPQTTMNMTFSAQLGFYLDIAATFGIFYET